MKHICVSLLFVAVASLLGPSAARACDAPVFDYALRNWPVEPYRVLVFTDGEDEPAALEALRRFGTQDNSFEPRFLLSVVRDDQEVPQDLAQLRRTVAGLPRPQMVVLYPESFALDSPFLTAPLDADNVAVLADSPVRQETARRILAGEAAVWVLLEGADPAATDAVEEALKTHLAAAAEKIAIPHPDEYLDPLADPDEPARNLIRPRFSVLRLSRTDPDERAFLALLVGLDENMKDYPGPVGIPIFGRGRALCALPEDMLDAEGVLEACGYITQSCSCLVKGASPGTDVLLSTDWYAVPPLPAPEPPPLAGISSGADLTELEELPAPADATGPQTPATAQPAQPATDDGALAAMRRLSWSAMAVLGVVIVAGVVLTLGRRRRNGS